MANNRIPANNVLRSKILSIADELIIGERIKTPTVAARIAPSRFINRSNHRIGRLLAEVPFLEAEGDGVFRRVR